MPGTDGIEFLQAVRRDYPTLPFILFTGRGSEEVASEAISAGVTDYLQKETGTDQYAVLANRVENAVEKHRAERTIEQTFSAIETAREGISLLDEDGHFVYVNRAYGEIFGYDPTELRGEHWSLIYPDEDVETVSEEILPALGEEQTWTGETRHVRADGAEIVTDHALAYTAEGMMICAVREVTDDPDPVEGLPERTLDALDDLLYVFDEDGTLEYWNDSLRSVTGYSDAKLSSMTPAEFVREADRDRMADYVETVEATGEARVEAELLTADGETIPYEFISKRVTAEDGTVLGRIGLGRNISERKRYEQEIERHNERLEHFAEVLSHDLRNPLSVATGRLELLYETGDRDHYETASRALNRMESMIRDVLTMAQSGEDIAIEEYEAVELEAVAERAWSLLQHDGASLDVLDSITVEADASRLQQVLENLFRNTVEHGSDDVAVRLGVLSDSSGFYVEDDGPGIPPDERDGIFEPGHSTKTDGTGFGLASVEQIADAHGWTVAITESEEGGARFEIAGVDGTE
jgi:PAS domain S-box-containing protein